MARTKAQPPITVDDGANDVDARFYISDAPSGNQPRVEVRFLRGGQLVDSVDIAVSALSTLTAQEKAGLRSVMAKVRDEAFTVKGYS